MSRVLRCRLAALVLSFTLLATLAAGPARAGQVRIDIVGNNFAGVFSPAAANLNKGDHAVWVWKGSSHTVTSGDSSTVTPDGIFDTDPTGLGAGTTTRFAWKSDRTGHVRYFCRPHAPDMAGRLIITDPLVSPRIEVSDFRITEVQYDIAGGQDMIEITNYGLAAGNLGRYRIAISASGSTELAGPAASPSDILVSSGGRVVIHLNVAGTNTNNDIFITPFNGTIGLPNTNGSLALYVPNTIAPSNALTRTDMIIDFVQWGAGAQPNEATAVSAGFWGAATFIPTVAATHSIEYCADVTLDHGVNRWAEVATPNFGLDGGCLTPVRDDSWGRIKSLYRQ